MVVAEAAVVVVEVVTVVVEVVTALAPTLTAAAVVAILAGGKQFDRLFRVARI